MPAELVLHFPPERVADDADRFDAVAFCQDVGVELGDLHAFERRVAGASRLDGVFIGLRPGPGDDEIPPGLGELVDIALENVRSRGAWARRAARARSRCA